MTSLPSERGPQGPSCRYKIVPPLPLEKCFRRTVAVNARGVERSRSTFASAIDP